MYNMRKRLEKLEWHSGPAGLDVRLLPDDELERIIHDAGGVGASLADYTDEELEAIVEGSSLSPWAGGLTPWPT